MKSIQLAIAICAALFTLPAVCAQNPPADTSLAANPVYKKDCAKCHGKTAGGRLLGGPPLNSGKATGMSAADLHTMIADGKGHMPKFAKKLTPDEIDTLVRQIQALNSK